MSGKNGGMPQVYNLIGGECRHSSSGEWHPVKKYASSHEVLCVVPRSTASDAIDAILETRGDLPEWRKVFPELVKTFYLKMIEGVVDSMKNLALAAEEESGFDREEILEELEKIRDLPSRWNFPSVGMNSGGGELKIMAVGGVAGSHPSAYSTVISAIIYELAINRSAVILMPSKMQKFCQIVGKIITESLKELRLPAGIFGLIYDHTGNLSDDGVLNALVDGKIYKIGNGFVARKGE